MSGAGLAQPHCVRGAQRLGTGAEILGRTDDAERTLSPFGLLRVAAPGCVGMCVGIDVAEPAEGDQRASAQDEGCFGLVLRQGGERPARHALA